jgi:hypothetical protein
MTRSYSDLSDGATTFDPEEQFDRDVDERMKGMSKEEAVARSLLAQANADIGLTTWEAAALARAAIAAADKWDAEQRAAACKHPRAQGVGSTGPNAITVWSCPDCGASYDSRKASQISPGLDSAIQDEEDHPPASIMRE